ncbi:hypothetical protein F5884DRAFT_836613 [Xylogone sp. PMI_703]|nr:hypothetical protein F5884DRAFT_836613 [Xylogone sp. PMI_703]
MYLRSRSSCEDCISDFLVDLLFLFSKAGMQLDNLPLPVMDTTQGFNPDDYNGNQLVITAVVLLPLTYIAVGLRCYVRLRIIKSFSIDDLLLVLSLCLFTLMCAFIFIGVHYGMGRHIATISIDRTVQGLKYQTFTVLAYEVCMTLVKLSVAIFLRRIAVSRHFIWLIKGSMIILTIWSTTLFLFTIFECSPVQAQWDITIVDGKCVSAHTIEQASYAQSALGICTDWFYAILPVLMLWNVKLNLHTKATVGIILSMGVFASVATIVRFRYIITVTALDDLLYATTITMVWTFIEPGVAIIAASLVTIRPLLRAIGLGGFDSTGDSPYPATNHATLSLRGDIPMDNWQATSYSLKRKKLRGGKLVDSSTINTSQQGMSSNSDTTIHEKSESPSATISPPGMLASELSDDGSEEFILAPGRIRRTVDVSIHTDDVAMHKDNNLHPLPVVTRERSIPRGPPRNR